MGKNCDKMFLCSIYKLLEELQSEKFTSSIPRYFFYLISFQKIPSKSQTFIILKIVFNNLLVSQLLTYFFCQLSILLIFQLLFFVRFIIQLEKRFGKMYSVLKSKRFRFQIPETEQSEGGSIQIAQQSRVSRQSSDMIVASCFVDDVFVLFLFNSGRYLVVDTASSEPKPKTQQKKSSTAESQIVYRGHILQELLQNQIQQKSSKQEKHSFTPPKKLLSKNSLTFIEQSYAKVTFTDCKRILPGECIIVTKHSANVFWLKLIKESVQKSQGLSRMIRTEICELPGSMFGDVLRLDSTSMMMNMTVLTELNEFDNSNESRQMKKLESSSKDYYLSRGSFYIKNEIIQDKMIYFTVYTRIPQTIRSKYIKGKNHQTTQLRYQTIATELPHFIVTKFQYAIPINEKNSNFVSEVCDRFGNEIAIYKQCEDDETEWEIKLYGFGFERIGGEELVVSYLKGVGEALKNESSSPLVIQNTGYIPKPKIIILPQQFTSSIHLQQFIRIDLPSQKSTNQSTYLIVSINQTHVEPQDPLQQPQIPQQQLGQAYRVNGQLVYFDQNGHIRPRQNTRTSDRCWTHVCRLTFQEGEGQFAQWVEKAGKFRFEASSFLKIVNINYEQRLLYVLRFAHERVNGQLYENKLDLVSMETGKTVQKGYLSLKNYSFSPNQRYILDVPQVFSTQQDFFFHIRLLFDKKTLYMFMIENSKKYFEHVQDVNFVQTILGML